MDFIESQAAAYPVLAEAYNEFGSLYSKKLWHQLSVKLTAFLADPASQQGDNWAQLYSGFIAHFEGRLNSVSLASIVGTIALSLSDAKASLTLLSKVLEGRDRFGAEAALCLDLDSIVAHTRLGDVVTAKRALDGAKDTLKQVQSSDRAVFSKYYRAQAEYRKLAGPPQEFYKAGLMFLAYTPLDTLAPAEAAALARDLALASITGEDIFNFGEVLATPVLGALKGGADEWLSELVQALHRGSIADFNAVVDAHRGAYFAQYVGPPTGNS